MASPASKLADLPPLIAEMRMARGASLIPVPREWSLDLLAGRLVELSSHHETVSLTAASHLVLKAQQRGEPCAWVATGRSTFYPPDVSRLGVDLSSLPVVRARDGLAATRATDHLLRSGAFSVVVFDMGPNPFLRPAMQTRLAGLAKKHHTTVLCLTHKSPQAPSLGSLISIRGEGHIERRGFNQFAWRIDVLKDKQHGPGWSHEEVCLGPEGLG